MSSLATNAITDASGGNTTTINGLTPTVSNMAGRNRIINGDMRIDQRHAGAAITITLAAYSVDRWVPQENNDSTVTAQQSTTSPAGFTNSLLLTASTGATSTSAQVIRLQQPIEGLNCSDLAWGTANAQPVTVSFWVRSSVTGIYCFGLTNGVQDRSYAADYSISVADTWEYKTITIAGDTSGTWLTTNGIGIRCFWDLGSGSDYNQTEGSWSGTLDWKTSNQVDWVGNTGATFYITGVQLEAGSVATPFEHRQYGQELALCQRYFTKFHTDTVYGYFWTGFSDATTIFSAAAPLPTAMRAQPTVTVSAIRVYGPSVGAISSSGTNRSSTTNIAFEASGSGFTTNAPGVLQANNNASAYITASSEL